MNLYRDNAKPPTLPVAAPELPRPIIQLPDAPEPWSFKTREHFPELMNRWGLTGTGVEVGVYRGGFSNLILREWPGVLYCVDPWEYQPDKHDLLNTPDLATNYDLAVRHLEPWIMARPVQRCYIVRQRSVDAAADFVRLHGRKPFLDWVYVDALHDYASCLADLTAWAPLIRPGGALCGHDYLDHPPGGQTDFGVVSAVRDWCKANDYSVADDVLTTTHDGYPSYVIRLR